MLICKNLLIHTNQQVKDKLWKSQFWKIGYFINTTGGANIKIIKQYIENQSRR